MIRQGSKWLMKPPLGYGLDRSHIFAASGVKAAYLLNECGGTLCDDFSGNNNAGTFTGAPAWQAGPWGSQLGGFTTSDYVVLDPTSQVFGGTYPCWMASLAVCNSTSTGYTIFTGGSTRGFGGIQYSNTSITYFLFDDGSENVDINVGSSIPTDNLPHLVAGVSYGSNNNRFYVDGIEIGTDLVSNPSTCTFTQLTLGIQRSSHYGANANAFPGSLIWAGLGNGAVPNFAALWADFWAPYTTPAIRRWYAPSGVVYDGSVFPWMTDEPITKRRNPAVMISY